MSSPSQVSNSGTFGNDLDSNFWRIIGGCAAGTFFEYYNYGLISYFADEISNAFFPSHQSGEMSLLESFGLFGVGYLVMPFGGMFFGWLADTRGRRLVLYVTMIGMGVPTILIGCLPTYSQIGYAATILVFFLRIVQGLAVSGEYTNAMLYVYEQCCFRDGPDGPKWTNLAFAQGVLWSGGSGVLLVAIWKVALDAAMNESVLYDYGWRIPFWFGIIIFLVGFLIRRQLPTDSIEDSLHNPVKNVLFHLNQFGWPILLITTGFLQVGAGQALALYWIPDFLADLHDPSDEYAYYGAIATYVFGFGCMLCVAVAVDKLRESGQMSFVASGLICYAVMIVFTPLLMVLIYFTENTAWLTVEQVLIGIVQFVPMPVMLSYAMMYVKDQNIRSTIVTLSYNLQAVHGGLTPEILTAIAGIGGIGGNLCVGLYMCLMAAVTATSLYVGTKYPYVHTEYAESSRYHVIPDHEVMPEIDVIDADKGEEHAANSASLDRKESNSRDFVGTENVQV